MLLSVSLPQSPTTTRTDLEQTGLFSLNIHIPADGARGTHREADGTLAGFRVFYTVLGVTLFAGLVMWFIIFLIFRSSHTAMKKRGPRVELGTTRVNIQS